MNDGGGSRLYRGGNGPATTDIDESLKLLAHPTRRTILYQLVTDPSNTAEIDDLIKSCADITGKNRDQLKLAFRHAHVPVLKQAGVIEVDEKSDEVEYNRDPFIEEVLDVIHQREG